MKTWQPAYVLGSATLVLEAFQKSKHSTAFRDNRPKMYNLMIITPLIMPWGKNTIHLWNSLVQCKCLQQNFNHKAKPHVNKTRQGMDPAWNVFPCQKQSCKVYQPLKLGRLHDNNYWSKLFSWIICINIPSIWISNDLLNYDHKFLSAQISSLIQAGNDNMSSAIHEQMKPATHWVQGTWWQCHHGTHSDHISSCKWAYFPKELTIAF